jgi:predicted alpha/beta-fold hydrolase
MHWFLCIPGGSHEGYCKGAAMAAAARGWRAVVLNLRGCGGLPLTSARGYNALQTHDVHVAVSSIQRWGTWVVDMGGSVITSPAAFLCAGVCPAPSCL